MKDHRGHLSQYPYKRAEDGAQLSNHPRLDLLLAANLSKSQLNFRCRTFQFFPTHTYKQHMLRATKLEVIAANPTILTREIVGVQ